MKFLFNYMSSIWKLSAPNIVAYRIFGYKQPYPEMCLFVIKSAVITSKSYVKPRLLFYN